MERKELEKYINDYGKDIYSFCKSLTGRTDEADDLYQETFLTILERNNLEQDGNPKSYLLGIAVRLWRNRRRKYAWRKRIAEVVPLSAERQIEELPSGENIEDRLLREQEAEIVRAVVERLPDKMRIVVLLYYMEELSVSEICVQLGLSASAVKTRLLRARKILKKELEDMGL